MGRIITTLVLERQDKFHHVLERREVKSRSWLLKLMQFVYIMSGYNSNTLANIKDITNINRTLHTLISSNLQVTASPGGAPAIPIGSFPGYVCYVMGENLGIVVGSGVTALSTADYALATKIDHGRGAGQILHGGTEVFGLTFTNPNGQFTIQRYFTNNSGGAITINEIGIYSAGEGQYSFCIYRDLVSPAVVVADTEILLAQIIPGITV
jgi:hypothetical protein